MMVKVVFHMAQDVLYHSGLPTKGRGRALEMLWCKSKSKSKSKSTQSPSLDILSHRHLI
jgi:hypothetical protein